MEAIKTYVVDFEPRKVGKLDVPIGPLWGGAYLKLASFVKICLYVRAFVQSPLWKQSKAKGRKERRVKT